MITADEALRLAAARIQELESKLGRLLAVRDELCVDHQDDDPFDAGVRYAVHMLTEPPK